MGSHGELVASATMDRGRGRLQWLAGPAQRVRASVLAGSRCRVAGLQFPVSSKIHRDLPPRRFDKFNDVIYSYPES